MATKEVVKKIPRILPLPTIRDIVRLYNLRASRQLSQNFLMKENLNNKIVKVAGNIKGADVLEVGPGPGNITRSILSKSAEKVIVIEKDRRFLPALEMLQESCGVPLQIITGDILHFNMEDVFSDSKRKAWDDRYPQIHIIGNLPFNISTALTIRWLRNISERTSAWSYGRVKMTLTFQKEVANRIEAPVMSAARSRFSVMCQNWCEVSTKFIIPGSKFVPKPEVDVGVVLFKPRIQPIIPLPFHIVNRVATAVFKFRQKYVRKGIESLFPENQEHLVDRMFLETDIDPNTRPFQLSVVEIGQFCNVYKTIIDENSALSNYGTKSVRDSEWLTKEETEEIKINEWKNELPDDFY